MAPVSTPTVKPVPPDVAYGLDVLKLLHEYDRAGYAAAFGIDPPTYDSALPTKGWFDSSADAAKDYTYDTYIVFGLDVPQHKSVTIPGAQAAAVNIYGLHSYPKYVIAPSQVMTVDPTGITNSPVPAVYLSLRDQALSLATQLGLNSDSVLDGTLVNGLFKTVYPPGENRKLWLINFKGVQVSAGTLIQEQNANGVGAPGRWDLTGPEPNWISGIPSNLPPANPVQPVPMRLLMDSEEFSQTLMGPVIKTKASDQAGAVSGSGLTPAQDSALTSAKSGVDKLLAWFRVS